MKPSLFIATSKRPYASRWCEAGSINHRYSFETVRCFTVLVPNLDTCYSDMVKHHPTQTHKSRAWESGCKGHACGSTPCSCETDAGCHTKCGCPFKTINKALILIIWTEPNQHPRPLSSLLYFPLAPDTHSTLVAGHTSIMSETQMSSTGQGMSLWNTSKVSSHETSYGIHGQLTQRIRVNKMFSGCFCLSYSIVLCGFTFKLRKLLCSLHRLE